MDNLIDISIFNEIVAGDVETFLPIIDDLAENGTDLIAQIKTAHGAGDLSTIRKAAHQLKGSTGMLGMEPMFEICKAVEQKELSEITTGFLDEFQTIFTETLQAARALLGA